MKNSFKTWLYFFNGLLCSLTQPILAQQVSNNPTYDNSYSVGSANTDEAESYPYLSADSKRLYFIRGDNGKGQLMVAYRDTKNIPFLKPDQCSYTGGTTNIFYNISSFYLTPPYKSLDGSTSCNIERDLFAIYYENNTQKMRVFARNNCNVTSGTGAFSTDNNRIVRHNISWSKTEQTANIPVLYTSPSIKRNDTVYTYVEKINNSNFTHSSFLDLYLHYQTANGKKGIVYLKQYDNNTGSGKYYFLYQYRLAENIVDKDTTYETLGGSLSKNGKRYYLCLKNKISKRTSLYYIDTKLISNIHFPDSSVNNSNNFSNYIPIKCLDTQIKNLYQPSFSDYAESTQSQDLAIITNSTGYWDDNNIRILQYNHTASGGSLRLAQNSTVNLFAPIPNPSNGEVTFNFSLPTETKEALINIFSIDGILIKALPIHNCRADKIAVRLNDIGTGLYYCTLVSDKGTSSQRLAIIK